MLKTPTMGALSESLLLADLFLSQPVSAHCVGVNHMSYLVKQPDSFCRSVLLTTLLYRTRWRINEFNPSVQIQNQTRIILWFITFK